MTATWARYASELRYEHLPENVIERLKGLLLDTIGTALAGSGAGDGAEAVAGFVLRGSAPQEASLIGYDQKVDLLGAAFANGAFAHSLNYDASGPRGGHIGLAAVPAPLAFAERAGKVSGKDLLAAIAAAAELTSRLAAALALSGVDANERFLEGQLLGYFGATVGASRIMRFTAERTQDALGIALMQTAGTRQVSFEGRSAKAIYGGYPNQAAATAVLLAEQGLDARCRTFDGPSGLFALFFNDVYDRGAVADGLGEDFQYLDIRFKPWPTSNRLHPFIRAAAQLRREHAIAPSEIAAIRLGVAPMNVPWLEPEVERRHPQNAATAANSIFFAVAKALVNGSVTLADVSAQGIREPAADSVADLISYTVDDSLTHTMAAVEVETKSGTIVAARDEGRRGGMAFSDLVEKFQDCARHAKVAVPPQNLQALVDNVVSLETMDDISGLIAGLYAPTAGER